ncbi:hypothetical protein DP939_08315 [Spongiactinospora rosea]|uniref:Glycosyl hydrolase n=1 Tax=Spongiactinospora rosea TaxID=2248750 RepID=A0A366M4T3_9ACTN|nr:glycoside hydrolase family 76 protein [Spongiactinospora rosea]RBQ21047.1 hypothetical protein DP939_08315 [Spongiactinospora rosea]
MNRISLLTVLAVCAATLLIAQPQAMAAPRICHDGICDGDKDPVSAREDRLLQPVEQWGRAIELHVSYADGGGMAWASIGRGAPGDPVWLDRSFDGGSTWEPHLGITSIPAGATGRRTRMHWIDGGLIRACGKAGDRPEVACTTWLPICRSGGCDGADPDGVAERAVNPHAWVWYRRVTLHVATDGERAWASMDDGVPADEVWLDRSRTGGASWDGRLGLTARRTGVYAIDGGLIRACGKAGDRPEIACTPWVSPGEQPPDLNTKVVDELMLRYDPAKALWGPGEPEQGIWLSANAFTALLDHMIRTGDRRYTNTVTEIANRHPNGVPAHSFEDYYDDFAWWGLAWIRAYDLTGAQSHLDKAERIATTIRAQWNSACGGGVRWRAGDNVKNLITNTLYLKLAASLHRRGRTSGWLAEAQKVVTWLRDTSGGRMLYDQATGLMRDGVHEASPGRCAYFPPLGANTYTYLQGTMAGGLTELYRATGDTGLLDWAATIADATTTRLVTPRGVLFYAPEEGGDGLKDENTRAPSDDTAFKGATVRNLRELYDVSVTLGRPTAHWRTFLLAQRQALIDRNRSGWAEFGPHWEGRIRLGRYITFGSQLSAVDAFTAARDV